MKDSNDNIRVVIPLTIRKRNGRPKILPPVESQALEARRQDPHILKALGRAWAWRRKLESGEVSTAEELAKVEGMTERFVSRTARLAYLSPGVLESLLLSQRPPQITWYELVATAILPWAEHREEVFGSEFKESRNKAQK